MDKVIQKRLNDILTKAGHIIVVAVGAVVPQKSWKHALFFSRGGFSKLRIEMNDGTFKGIHSPTGVGFFDLVDEIWDMKAETGESWNAFKLTICPDGKCGIEFSDKPSDPDFFMD